MKNQNLLQAFHQTVAVRSDATALRYKEDSIWQELNWNQLFEKVTHTTGGLATFGLKPGDKVAIFSKTRYEWTIADMAILGSGAVTVPIYESSLPDQAAYILKDSEARIVFVENETLLKKILSERKNLPHLKQIIVIDLPLQAKKEEGVYSMLEVMMLGSETGFKIFKQNEDQLKRDSIASYVYTSGTTGPPKGAVLSHGNFLAELDGLTQALDFSVTIESLIFLPLAHILARVVQFAHLSNGFVQCYAESIDKLLDNISEVRPHLMASVPRIFEKVHTRVMQGLETSSPLKKKLFHWAVKVGNQRLIANRKGKSLSPLTHLQWLLASKLVFSKLHQKMGGRIAYFISGGAPLSQEIGEFFECAGFLILEGYGLTETSAAIAINTRKFHKMGAVGKALPGVEIKIAPDGEILTRGGVVFQGYYNKPADTAEVLEADGWFHTGDIGIIDDQGFVKITDRKKDIIVTAAGKNIAPQNIENLMKGDPLISQVVVHGDRRKYLAALVTLNKEEIVRYAKSQSMGFDSYETLIRSDQIYQLIKTRIDEKNRHLAKYETIKKFAILENDFTVESGELTPTLKVKRKFTSEKYKDIIEQFYQET